MKKYSFPQFNAEIIDPKMEIMMDSIKINPINQTLDVHITLTTPTAKIYGVELKDIPRNAGSWDAVDLQAVVLAKLAEFEIKVP